MFKLATGAAVFVASVILLQGQRTATSQLWSLPVDADTWHLSMGPAPGGKSGTQGTADPVSGKQLASATSTLVDDEAEYRRERSACESLTGDARNHCVEYAKLRYGRS